MKREKVIEIFDDYLSEKINMDEAIDLLCEPEPRRPVGVTREDGYMTVICDDGSSFWHIRHDWYEFDKPIPGTRADLERKNG